MQVMALTARDIEIFSINAEPEMIMPRRMQVEAGGFDSDYRDFAETKGMNVKKSRQFTDEDKLKMESYPPENYTDEGLMRRTEHLAAHGWPSVDFALDMLKKSREMSKIARA